MEKKQVEKLKSVLEPGTEMVTAALRYVISHPTNAVAIPGCKSPAQYDCVTSVLKPSAEKRK